MDSTSVSSALQERLGPEATMGLVRLFDVARVEWTADVVNLVVERFERRLVEEIATVRVEMARSEARVREEIAQQGATLRHELAQQGATLRHELGQQGATFREALAQQGATLREALAQQGAELRVEIATNRFELLKWSFLFWVGQVIAMAAMLRAFGPAR